MSLIKTPNMKKIFLLIIAISFCYTIFSQNYWEQIHPYPTLNNLHDVHFNSEEEGWIIGNGHLQSSIMYTNDAGVTWETQISGQDEDAPYTSLFFIDDNEGWAGGWKCIYHTDNKGATWESQQLPNVYSIIEDIYFLNHNIGWAVGERNTILKTTDGGTSWHKKQYSFTSGIRFYSVSFSNALNGCAVGMKSTNGDGIIMHTIDGGETWIDVSPVSCYSFTSVTFVDSLTGWVCGFGGTGGQPAELRKTIDGGKTWIKQITDNYTRFTDIQFINQDTGMILDEHRKVHLTSNGGVSWLAITIEESSMRKLSYWDNTGCYSVGYNGKITKSTNGGRSWDRVGENMDMTMTDIGFFNSNDGLVTGFSGNYMLSRTENGGHTWMPDTILGKTEYYLMRIYGQTGYLVNTDFEMMKTSNGGESWDVVSIPQNGSIYNDMQFVNENTGFLCGNYGRLKKTTNGGISWQDKSLGTNKNLTELQFLNNNLGWMVDLNNHILLKTHNGGDTWADAGLSNVQQMFFVNESVGFVTTSNGLLYKTLNGGGDWNQMVNFLGGDGSVYFINETTGWYIVGSTVCSTYDGGITWQDEQYFAYTNIHDIFFLNNNQGWLAGTVGFVAAYDFTVNIDEIINNPSPISIFPNPAQEYVNINQSNGKDKIVDVKLFNIQSQEIMHFSHLSAPKSFKFNISNLQSGAYFIEITTEHNQYTVKFIVQ